MLSFSLSLSLFWEREREKERKRVTAILRRIAPQEAPASPHRLTRYLLRAWFVRVALVLTTEPFFVSPAQDAGVTDVVRKRKLAHDFEDLEFQTKALMHHQMQLDHAFAPRARRLSGIYIYNKCL